MNVLLLGGTTEGSELARLLAGDGRFAATVSLAGRTKHPAAQPLPVRVGGFGGVDGLARYLEEHAVDALVDATHPFAAQMTRHAAAAAERTGVPLLVVHRPAWAAGPGDRWDEVPDMETAADRLGPAPRRVFLTVGQQDLLPFAGKPRHDYLIRSVDPPPHETLPPGARIITARGPFGLEDERRLLARHRIEVLVTKNSGGSATGAKLLAARELGVRVVMVARPMLPPGVQSVATAAEAWTWLLAHHRTLRGA